MIKPSHHAQTSALPAIVAAMAFLSTPALAQQTQPTTLPMGSTATPDAQSAPPTQTAPADQSSPSVSDPTVPDTPPTDANAPTMSSAAAAPEPAHARPAHPVATKTTIVHRTAEAARSAAAPTATAAHAARSAAAPATTMAPAAPPPAAAPAAAVAATPAAKTAAMGPAKTRNDTGLEVAGGALALLVLGGGAYAIARRRRQEDEEEWYYDEPSADDVVEPSTAEVTKPPVDEHPMDERELAEEQPTIVAPAPSAFAWGKEAAPEDHIESTGDDRRPGETWVERAYRGPSANNPSYSLRRRLKRAAFFDKQEREGTTGGMALASNGTSESAPEQENNLVSA